MWEDIENRIRKLIEKGVVIIDPRQTYISPEVDIDRIYEGCVLFPGCRLEGPYSCGHIGTDRHGGACRNT